MLRIFATHHVRNQMQLSDSLWEFEPCSGEFAGQKFQLMVPGCWESHPLFADYRGEGIYRKRFEAQGNIRVECKGVSHTATLYLDGTEIGRHYNAYTPFSVLVMNLEPGEHTLEIKADNRFHENSALHVPNDYMSYGGISRGVIVETLNDYYLEYVHVKPYMQDGEWHAHIKAAVHALNCNLKGNHDLVVQGKLGENTFQWDLCMEEGQSGQEICTDLRMKIVEIWSPETP